MTERAKPKRRIRKPFYRINEVCDRWDISPADIAAFVLGKELQISVGVAKLRVEVGSWEQTVEGEWFRIPEGKQVITGVVDLFPEDAWHAINSGTQTVFKLKPQGNGYMEPSLIGDMDLGLSVALNDFVITHAEYDRFEAAHALAPVVSEVPITCAANGPSVVRGASPKYDWDAFWREVARLLLFDGVPESQAALVRRMEAWFTARGECPDTSTIKKKLSPLWRDIAPEAEHKRA